MVHLLRLSRRAGSWPCGLHASNVRVREFFGNARAPLAGFIAYFVRCVDCWLHLSLVKTGRFGFQRTRARRESLQLRCAQMELTLGAFVDHAERQLGHTNVLWVPAKS